MHELFCIMIGVFIGGAVGVVTMCLFQITQCSECPYRGNSVRRGGK